MHLESGHMGIKYVQEYSQVLSVQITQRSTSRERILRTRTSLLNFVMIEIKFRKIILNTMLLSNHVEVQLRGTEIC